MEKLQACNAKSYRPVTFKIIFFSLNNEDIRFKITLMYGLWAPLSTIENTEDKAQTIRPSTYIKSKILSQLTLYLFMIQFESAPSFGGRELLSYSYIAREINSGKWLERREKGKIKVFKK